MTKGFCFAYTFSDEPDKTWFTICLIMDEWNSNFQLFLCMWLFFTCLNGINSRSVMQAFENQKKKNHCTFVKSLTGTAAQFQQTIFERLEIKDHIEKISYSGQNVFKIQELHLFRWQLWNFPWWPHKGFFPTWLELSKSTGPTIEGFPLTQSRHAHISMQATSSIEDFHFVKIHRQRKKLLYDNSFHFRTAFWHFLSIYFKASVVLKDSRERKHLLS